MRLRDLYDISSRGNVRGKAKQGFIRPTICEFFDVHCDFQELISNDPPAANPDSVETEENVFVIIDLLANDTDPDNDDLTITILTDPLHGSLVDHEDGTVTYTPDLDYVGPDTFDYTISDGIDTATTSVSITVTPMVEIFTIIDTKVIDNPDFITSPGDSFGSQVGISSLLRAVGAPAEENSGDFGTNGGYIYIFDAINAVKNRVENPNAYATPENDRFGSALAMDDSYLVAGVAGEDDAGGAGSGKVYLIAAWTGNLVGTLDNPNPFDTSAGDQFGSKVGIKYPYIIASALGEDDAGGVGSGKAYIYDWGTQALLHTLDNPNAFGTSEWDQFGSAVAISSTVAVVGASSEDEAAGAGSGKAYVFSNITGGLLHTLDNPNVFGTVVSDSFGARIAVSETQIAITALYEDHVDGLTSGVVYVFSASTGALLHTLVNPNAYDTAAGDTFGASVTMTESLIAIAATGEDDPGGTGSGKVYVFSASTGTLLDTIDNVNDYGISKSDYFGTSIAMIDDHIIVGANGEDDASGLSNGKAYVFEYSLT